MKSDSFYDTTPTLAGESHLDINEEGANSSVPLAQDERTGTEERTNTIQFVTNQTRRLFSHMLYLGAPSFSITRVEQRTEILSLHLTHVDIVFDYLKVSS
jgi:hypothetical protein